MKILLVSYIYGNTLVGGAERFMAGLTRALTNSGHHVEVATTTASSLQALSEFGIHWVKGNPEGDMEEDGIPIHRFDVKNHDNLQRIASKVLLRRVQNDLKGRSYLNEDPETWIRFLVSMAKRRPSFYQSLYKFCRGPASPGLRSFLRARTREFDGVLATMVPFNTMAYAARAAHQAKRPVGVIPLFHHLDWYHHWSHFYETFREADHLFVLNDDSVSLFNRMGCRATRLGVGFDPSDFPGEPEGSRGFRDRFHLPQTGAMALFVGRKVQSKRYDLAMETIKRLRSKGYDVFLVMVGPEEDRKVVAGDGVFYLNRLPRRELLHAYQACDFLLEPTEFESFGIIFCEAWMYEKPVIGNRRCPAVASLIRHGKDGFLCSTVDEFTASVIALLREPESGRKMGKLGRQKVLSEYTWHRIVKKIEAGLFRDRGDMP